MLPWFAQARRENDLGISDCTKCQQSLSRMERQSLGCGYEAAPPSGIRVVPWEHTGRKADPSEFDERGQWRLPICAGYVCNLPEVREMARAHAHWDKGQLVTFCGGQPSEHVLEAVEILDYAAAKCRAWIHEEHAKRRDT